jgi:hypothetical protein
MLWRKLCSLRPFLLLFLSRRRFRRKSCFSTTFVKVDASVCFLVCWELRIMRKCFVDSKWCKKPRRGWLRFVAWSDKHPRKSQSLFFSLDPLTCRVGSLECRVTDCLWMTLLISIYLERCSHLLPHFFVTSHAKNLEIEFTRTWKRNDWHDFHLKVIECHKTSWFLTLLTKNFWKSNSSGLIQQKTSEK